ncbi:hypothetical protein AL473_13150 [Klebsiella quasipneumoniae]|nr:hypothetical protein [Klebsiella quasipneumoniae]AWO59868.1 hypothetical protein DLJ73_01830 [Klebsiella quasipneumoniae subsp. similipneumoniae]AMR15234.1 hypothetical protein AVR78_13160 [Klebsiella quasipneumoniae]AVF88608.1 hypothetical protein AL473_13150 [Klebsiella quasipneumoniae]MCS5984174.1 hypothetical protein [Klebsiella quasipneumoniae subsp. similipneumoniae]MDF5741663.1 hypothetical protein [Klebsiella quasipneumoniae]
MDSHDPKRIARGQSRQCWRAFWPIMHLHENHSTKRAGVAGIRARLSILIFKIWLSIFLVRI